MNAEAGSEPEAPKKRGRIPQSAWPQILERYRAGATLSAIAREFSCTPSAISYIVRKAEASGSDGFVEEGGGETAEAPVAEAAEAPAEPVEAPAAAREPAPERPVRRTLTAAMLTDNAPEPPAPLAPPPAPVAAPPAAPAAPRAAAGARPEPTPPVDEVEGRLRETARTCLAAYRGWRQTPGENSIQTLADAVHELRKALARIEIDMSASRKEEQAIRPIPIPSHRAARRVP
jgi:transposase-like protein